MLFMARKRPKWRRIRVGVNDRDFAYVPGRFYIGGVIDNNRLRVA